MYKKLKWLTVGVCVLTLHTTASGQQPASFPHRPIKLLVGFAPGGGSDYVARALAESMGSEIGQPVIVENRAGAGGSLAARAVASADADGYTLLLGSAAAFVINPVLMKSLPYDANADFAPVGGVARFSYVLLARKDLPVQNVGELVALAKRSPGKLAIGSAGNGSNTHLVAASLESAAGIDLLHVPYKGTTPALTDLMAGSIDLLFDSVPTVLGQVRSGKLRALGTSVPDRDPLLPDVPTLHESGVRNFSASNWFAVFAPKKTPPEIVAKLNQAVNRALASPKLTSQFATSGNTPLPGTPTDLTTLIAKESVSYAELIRKTGITID